jgi:lipid-binding SYLF domain-containing protein
MHALHIPVAAVVIALCATAGAPAYAAGPASTAAGQLNPGQRAAAAYGGKNFSLNADAGLTIGTYSARGQASGGKIQDVVIWSGAKGIYGGVSVGINDVIYDADATQAYYGKREVDPAQILDGRVQNPQSNVLGMVLAA